MTKSAPSGLEEVQPINIESEVSEVQLEAIIPKPVGYHILVAMPKVAETFGDSGLIKSAKTIHHDTILSMIGLVVDMGDQAYGLWLLGRSIVCSTTIPLKQLLKTPAALSG
jgi:hypothetical protein